MFAGLEMYHVPGHTAGSMFLYHRPSGILFSGDMLLNAIPPLTLTTALSLPCPAFTEDYPQALTSLSAFVQRDLPIRMLCPGHGPALVGNIRQDTQRLLDEALLGIPTSR